MVDVAPFRWRHYIWLVLWWLCLYYAIAYHSMKASIAFLLLFFVASTYRTLFKSILIGLICALLVHIPFVPFVLFIVGMIGILFRFKFLAQHWRVLLVGLYAYGVHFLMLLFNGGLTGFGWVLSAYYYAKEGGIEVTQTVSNGADFLGVIIATILVFILHRKILWLYKNNYSTERAFLIMGLTPLIVIATIFPFLSHIKIGGYDLTGESFLDADSIADAADSLSELETGAMGAAAHGTNDLASLQKREDERKEASKAIESELNRMIHDRRKE